MMMKNNKAIDMGFNWLFAIIVGAIILFLGIYGASKIIGIGSEYTQTESAAKLSNLLSGAGIVHGISYPIEFSKETRTYYDCDDQGDFGRNTIAFSEKLFNKWGEKGGEISVVNKYIFAEEIEEGNLYVSSQAFFMPFKIADLIFISSKDYCFVEPPNNIEDDLTNMKNIKIIDSDENCEGTRVCFIMGVNTNCDIDKDIIVMGESSDFSKGSVKKNKEDMYFVDGLLYGAIFSDKEIYDCNVRRLMKKFNELAEIYNEKINIIRCGENLKNELIIMKNGAVNLDDSQELRELSDKAEIIDQKNKVSGCRLYESK